MYVAENSFWPVIGSLSSVLIHVIPLNLFNSQIENFSSHELGDTFKKILSPPGYESYSHRYCLEGFHLFQNHHPNSPNSIVPYNLIFRNGSTETFTNGPFFISDQNKLSVDGIELLKVIKEQLEKNFKLCQKLSIEPYFYLSIKLNNISNMNLTPREIGLGKPNTNNDLQFPIILLQPDIQEIKKQLKNIMDILWQSVGANECPSNKFNKVFETFVIN